MSTDPKPCGHERAGYGPYGATWACQRTGLHWRHRFRNYTWPRIPRVWHVRPLARTWRTNRRLIGMGASRHDGLLRYRAVLYPTRFEPLPVVREVPGV